MNKAAALIVALAAVTDAFRPPARGTTAPMTRRDMLNNGGNFGQVFYMGYEYAPPNGLGAQLPAVWKSTSASGAPENSSLSHFSAMTRPCWLRRAVRNWHTATPSRHRVDGVEVDATIQHERAVKF